MDASNGRPPQLWRRSRSYQSTPAFLLFSSLSDSVNLSGEFVVNGKGIELDTDDGLLDIRDKINSADAALQLNYSPFLPVIVD